MLHRHVHAMILLAFLLSFLVYPASAEVKRYVVYDVNFLPDDDRVVKINPKLGYAVLSKPPEGIRYEKDAIIKALFPDDPKYPQQWYLESINADRAWERAWGNPGITVAVIDTGINYLHPDLKGNMWINEDEIPDNGIDDDGNGYVDDYYGYDFVNGDGNPMDDNGHGTFVAGIIASQINNSLGVAGIAQVKIMALKVLGSDGTGYESDLAEAIYYAVENGADIISMSLGGSEYIELLENACNDAWNSNVLLVAASGNDGSEIDYPARFGSVIAVGSIDENNKLSSFSDYGREQEIVAPGENILSTYPGGSYKSLSGTSASTPQVSGVAALILSMNPDLSNRDIRKILQQSADDLGIEGKDPVYGYGKLNASGAVSLVPLRGSVSGKSGDFEFMIEGSPLIKGSGFLNISWSGTGNIRILGLDGEVLSLNLSSGGNLSYLVNNLKPGGYELLVIKDNAVIDWFYFRYMPGPEIAVESIAPDTLLIGENTSVEICMKNTGDDGYYPLQVLLNSTPVFFSLIHFNLSEELCTYVELPITQEGEYVLGIDGYTFNITALLPPLFILNVSTDRDMAYVDEEIKISGCVQNMGSDGNYTMNFTVNGQHIESRTVFVPENQTVCVSFNHSFSEPGIYNVSVNSITKTVEIIAGFLPEINFSAEPTAGYAPLNVTVKIEVRNSGDRTGVFPVKLFADGVKVKELSVKLDPGERVNLKFRYTFHEPGNHTLTVNDLQEYHIEVFQKTGDLDGDGWNDTLEALIARYYSDFNPATDTPSENDLMNAVAGAVLAYFETSDQSRKMEVFTDITELVQVYFNRF